MRALLVAAVLASLVVAPRLAQAQRHHQADPRDEQARALFDQGSAAYEEGRYEEAISAFEEAYSLSSRPLLLFNIANAQERLGRLSDALDNLRVYFEDAPEDERPVLERRMRALEQRVQQQNTQEQQRQQQTQQIAEQAANAAAQRVAGQGHHEEGPPVDPVPWILIGTGGGMAVLSVVFGVLALGARDDASHACAGSADMTFCTSRAGDALSRDGAFSLLTDISALLAIAGVATGIVLLVTHKDEPREHAAPAPTARVSVAPRLGGAQLVLDGVF